MFILQTCRDENKVGSRLDPWVLDPAMVRRVCVFLSQVCGFGDPTWGRGGSSFDPHPWDSY